MTAVDHWQEPIRNALNAAETSTLFVIMPDYRPDLIKQLAHGLQFDFIDIRAELLMPRGWDAAKVSAREVNTLIQPRSKGLVLHNSEAWLATKSAPDRQAWLTQMTEHAPDNALIISLMVFGAELPETSYRIQLDPAQLPAPSLLSRFMHYSG